MKAAALLAAALALPARAEAPASHGIALLAATQPDSRAGGAARFFDDGDGLQIKLSLSGLAPGKHGLHIHEHGSCADAGRAAGGHYNPEARPHGDGIAKPKKFHAGDLGNVEADANGHAVAELRLPRLRLSGGKRAVAGRALIVTEKADEFSQPLGNAGGRLACGAIVLAGPQR